MDKIKVGQIGVCHEHASGKMNTLKLLPEVFEIVGIVDDRNSTTPKFAGSNVDLYKDLKWMTEEELFNTPGLQGVFVETPNLDLVPTALRCMERNLPMHMDKPGGESFEDFEILRKGCEERKLPFQMGYMFRGNPAIQWTMKAINEGWLGDIFEIQASMSHNYGEEPYQEYIGKFKGGIMFNLGCHLVDLVVAMLGRPDNVMPFLKSAPGYSDSIKNNCLTILEYPHATVTLRACSKEISGLNDRRFKLCGTKGTVEFCPMERFDGKAFTMQMALAEDIPDYNAGFSYCGFWNYS